MQSKKRISGVELADRMKGGLSKKFLNDLKELKKSRGR